MHEEIQKKKHYLAQHNAGKIHLIPEEIESFLRDIKEYEQQK